MRGRRPIGVHVRLGAVLNTGVQLRPVAFRLHLLEPIARVLAHIVHQHRPEAGEAGAALVAHAGIDDAEGARFEEARRKRLRGCVRSRKRDTP